MLKDNYNCDILKKTKNIVINTNSYSNFFESEERNKKKSIKYIFQNSYRNTSREKESSSDKSFLPTLSTEKIIKKNINSRNVLKQDNENLFHFYLLKFLKKNYKIYQYITL